MENPRPQLSGKGRAGVLKVRNGVWLVTSSRRRYADG